MSAVVTVIAIAACMGVGALRILLPLLGIQLPGLSAW